MAEDVEKKGALRQALRAAIGLAIALGLFLVLTVPGFAWGLPSAERNALTFGEDRSAWKGPDLSEAEAENPWSAYPNYLEGGPERKGQYPRSAFNPVRTYHPDEYAIVKSLSGMRPSRLQLDPGFFGWPACHIYLTGVGLKIASLTGGVKLVPDMNHYFAHPEDMARIYLVGRGVTLCFALGCIVALWRTAWRLFGPVGGEATALLTAVMPVFCVNARWLTADMAMLFWMSLALLMATHIRKSGQRKWAVLAGVFLGLAAGTRYQGGIAAFFIVAACFDRHWKGHIIQTAKDGLCDKTLWLAAGVSMVVFLLVNPYIALKPGQFVQEFFGELSGSHGAGTWVGDMLLFAVMGLGVVMSLLTLGTLLMALARRERAVVFVLLAFGAPTLLLMLAHPAMTRYFLPVCPLPPLLAGWALAALHREGTAHGRGRAGMAVACIMAISAGLVALQTGSYARLFILPKLDTRTRAGQWIASHVPEGATVGVASIPWQFELPPLNERKYRLRILDPANPARSLPMPDYIVTSDLQFPPLAIRGPLNAKEKAFWKESFRGGTHYKVIQRFEAWPPSMGPLLRMGPHDMRYANPVIVIARRATATAPLAQTPPAQEGALRQR